LHPNASTFYFRLNAREHRLYVQTYSSGKTLTPRSIFKFFDRLFDDLNLTRQYGPVTLTLVQSQNGLNAVLNTEVIRELTITIYRPNPDIFAGDFDANIADHLEAARSKKLVLSYESEPRGSVAPTEEIRAISAVAIENGKVEVRGRDQTGAVKKSTDDHPRVIQSTFDSEEISEREAFDRLIPPANGDGQ
jgi:hypothetical protein